MRRFMPQNGNKLAHPDVPKSRQMARVLRGHRPTLSPYICARCEQGSFRDFRGLRAFETNAKRYMQGHRILSLLEQRGYVNQIAGDRNALDRLVQSKRVGFYAGIDPTAPSLHLGHLLPLMVLFWLYHHGHSVVSLVGGGTARVGDPSGRLTSRAKTTETVHETNVKAMSAQVGRIWDNATHYGQRHGFAKETAGRMEQLDNASWLDNLNLLDFLKVLGHGVRLGTMLKRDTVRSKMENGDGMSFSEFTYPLLQAWDWWHMYRALGIQVQIGGSDQYGNIVAGMDAVKYIAQTSGEGMKQNTWLGADVKLKEDLVPMGLTVPLLTTSGGEKFGKSTGNAIWLDRSMTSTFDLYGFLLRSSDEDVERYLKLFTFISLAEIETLMAEHSRDPGRRKAQHLLASEVLELVHGREEAEKTRAEHQVLRNPSLASLARKRTAVEGSDQGNTVALQHTILPSSLVLNTPFSRILYHAGIVPTRTEGTRLVAKGGVYVASGVRRSQDNDMNFVPIKEQGQEEVSDYVRDGLLILRTGKWKVRVLEVVKDTEFDARQLDAPGWQDWKKTRPA